MVDCLIGFMLRYSSSASEAGEKMKVDVNHSYSTVSSGTS